MNLIVTPALLLYGDLHLSGFKVKYSFETEDLPDPLTFFLTFVFLIVVEDLGFHIFHRLAHWKVIYPYFHKLHHNYTTTVSIGGEYFHPVDYFMGVLIPGSFGPNLLGRNLHIATYFAWALLRTGEGVDGHSGYEFPWSPYRLLPFSTSAAYHDYHHTHNVGNYSSFLSIWDAIFGDN